MDGSHQQAAPGSAGAATRRSQRAALDAVWYDRDLGWLEFNRRVLAEAFDDRTPLLERAKFLAIFASNLDEFFMKRVALLREQDDADSRAFRQAIRDRLDPMLREQAAFFHDRLVPELSAHGVHLRTWAELTPAQQIEASTYFDHEVSPALTPLVIDVAQPFPFFSNLSLSVSFVLQDDTGEVVNARVKVPTTLKPWVPLSADVPPGQHVLVRLHEVIQEQASKLYPGMRLGTPTLFRLTRDAEVDLDDTDQANLRELVREQIRQRRYEPAVRLQVAPGMDERLRHLLQQRFSLTPEEIYDFDAELDYSSLFQIAALPLPHLRDRPWTPVTPARLAGDAGIFEAIRGGDLLVHHPYESFDDSVERFIATAADDPSTVAIKMTVYRVGDDTPFVRSLIRAAEAGKQVACVIELQARFDEERNLHWAVELERAGAHVSVGNARLKTHAKVALVVRQESHGLQSYAHIGTGNYHVRTARLYTDVGLLTCDPVITADVVNLFHHLTGRSRQPSVDTLLVAPHTMRQGFLQRIAREIDHHRHGRPARIVAKMNQLEDPAMIAALCEASQAGLPVDLIVRGFCCLRPGVPGMSETVRIRSIVGRFLEHSRIFHFANGSADPVGGDFLIGSADWMTRNLSDRIEVVTPVHDAAARARLWDILDVCLHDRRQAWVMDRDGHYTQLRPTSAQAGPAAGAARAEQVGTQMTLIERMQETAERADVPAALRKPPATSD